MAGNYQNVGRPRFWVSTLQWLDSLGMIDSNANDTLLSGKNYKKLPYINSTEATNFKGGGGDPFEISFDIKNSVNWANVMPDDNSFFMLLGHNFQAEIINNVDFRVVYGSDNQNLAQSPYLNYVNLGEIYKRSPYQGFSIGTANNAHNNKSIIFLI